MVVLVIVVDVVTVGILGMGRVEHAPVHVLSIVVVVIVQVAVIMPTLPFPSIIRMVGTTPIEIGPLLPNALVPWQWRLRWIEISRHQTIYIHMIFHRIQQRIPFET